MVHFDMPPLSLAFLVGRLVDGFKGLIEFRSDFFQDDDFIMALCFSLEGFDVQLSILVILAAMNSTFRSTSY